MTVNKIEDNKQTIPIRSFPRIKISNTKSWSGNDNNEYLNTIDNVLKYMANYCFTVPFLPGGIELARKWNQENIVNNKEHDEVFNEAGISREQVWIQHLPQGDFAVASYETDDPEKSFKVLATSNKPWAVKFREHLNKAHGLDIAQSSMQLNEVAVNWK